VVRLRARPAGPGHARAAGLVEGPLAVLHLDSMETDAASKQQADPLAAAALFGTVAQGLQEGGFPGHATAMRHRQAAAAEAGGDQGMAFSILTRLSLDAVLAGEPLPLLSAGPKLGELAAALGQAAGQAAGARRGRQLV
jgi:hypothetical protein